MQGNLMEGAEGEEREKVSWNGLSHFSERNWNFGAGCHSYICLFFSCVLNFSVVALSMAFDQFWWNTKMSWCYAHLVITAEFTAESWIN